MADSPPTPYPEHGTSGKGGFNAGWPNDEHSTPNFRGRELGEHNPDTYSTNYPDHISSYVNPPGDTEAANHFIHPFKLQRYTRILTEAEVEDEVGGSGEKVRALRVYYGELWSTVTVIKTEGSAAVDSGGTEKNIFGISEQMAIPGIERTVFPDFSNTAEGDDPNNIRRETYKYLEWTEKMDGDETDGGAYGIVLLTWLVNCQAGATNPVTGEEIPLGAIKEAFVHKVATTDDIPEDQDIIKLAKVASGPSHDLKRSQDNVGVYTVVIGESRNMEELDEDDNLINEGKSPIDQQVYDHVYWASTLVVGSDGESAPDDPWVSLTFTDISGGSPDPPALVADHDDIAHGLLDRVVINGNRNLVGQAQEQQ